MTTVDLAQVDRDISQIIEPTGTALDQARRTVQAEHESLTDVRKNLEQRLGQIDQRLETLSQLDKKLEDLQRSATEGNGSTARAAASKADLSMSDLAASVLKDANKPIDLDAIAERIQERTGSEVDKRGLAGALNGGVRSGRFAKTRAGRFKLGS